MKTFFTSLSLSLIALLATACGVTKTMDDMSATTSKMSGTTSKMSATTETLSATTTKMAATTDGLALDTKMTAREVAFSYVDARTANTCEARQRTFDGLLNASGKSTKLLFAAEYFGAMDYQFWKAYTEATSSRNDLKELAVTDFFLKTNDLIDHVKRTVGSLDSRLADPQFLSLCSLAASMHMVNLAQMDVIKQSPETKITSMLTMLEEGLASKDDMNQGKIDANSIPHYQILVQQNAENAVFLLKLRQNYLKAMALTLASQSDNGDDYNASFLTTKKALGCLADPATTAEDKKACAAPSPWISDFQVRNVSQIGFVAFLLELSNETKGFLQAQKQDPESDLGVATMFHLMKIDLGTTPLPAILAASDRVSKALTTALAK